MRVRSTVSSAEPPMPVVMLSCVVLYVLLPQASWARSTEVTADGLFMPSSGRKMIRKHLAQSGGQDLPDDDIPEDEIMGPGGDEIPDHIRKELEADYRRSKLSSSQPTPQPTTNDDEEGEDGSRQPSPRPTPPTTDDDEDEDELLTGPGGDEIPQHIRKKLEAEKMQAVKLCVASSKNETACFIQKLGEEAGQQKIEELRAQRREHEIMERNFLKCIIKKKKISLLTSTDCCFRKLFNAKLQACIQLKKGKKHCMKSLTRPKPHKKCTKGTQNSTAPTPDRNSTNWTRNSTAPKPEGNSTMRKHRNSS